MFFTTRNPSICQITRNCPTCRVLNDGNFYVFYNGCAFPPTRPGYAQVECTGTDTSGCVYRDGAGYNCDTVLGTYYYFGNCYFPYQGVPVATVFCGGDWSSFSNWCQVDGMSPGALPQGFSNVTTSINATNKRIDGPFNYCTPGSRVTLNTINIDSFFTNYINIYVSNLSYIGGDNRGTFCGPVQFAGTNYCNVYNVGSNYTLFSYSSKNCGTVTGLTRLENGARNYGTICGDVCTQNTPYNCGTIIGNVICSCQALYNYGSISGNVDFGLNGCNYGIVSGNILKSAYFKNFGTITQNALFSYSSMNSGNICGAATFCCGAINCKQISGNLFFYNSSNSATISGLAYFYCNSCNNTNGIIAQDGGVICFDNSSNLGKVCKQIRLFNNSINCGQIFNRAYFYSCSINWGVVCSDISCFGDTGSINNGFVYNCAAYFCIQFMNGAVNCCNVIGNAYFDATSCNNGIVCGTGFFKNALNNQGYAVCVCCV
jgi:hypothetical protein